MIWSALASALHLLALAGGVACVFLRADALGRPLDEQGLRRVFAIDNLYGLVALAWIGSGVWRAFGTVEKGSAYYLHNHLFWGKLLLLGIFLAVEAVPMVTFIRWRIQVGRGQTPDTTRAARLRALHWVELVLIGLIVLCASGMARGLGVVVKQKSAADLAAGERVYTSICASCHGLDGTGRNGTLAADFVHDRARLAKSDDALLRSIERGVPGTAMAAFGAALPESDRRAVLAYIRTRFGEGAPR